MSGLHVSSHDITVAGYVALLVAAGVLSLAGHRHRAVLPLRVVLGHAMRTRTGGVTVMAAWAWVGLHFFAR